MSLRAKLAWAFVGVAFMALLLSFLGLSGGLYATMAGMHRFMGMGGPGHEAMMDGAPTLQATLRVGLFSSLLAFGLAGALGSVIAGRITTPLRHLREAAGRLDLRDLSQRVPVEGDDEIADLARTFNRMGDRLEADERARRQLLADVAHELRHPLAVLQGRLEMMQDGIVPLEQGALLPLQDEVIRLTRLVGDLRDLSLAEVGGLTLHKTPLDLGVLVLALLENLGPVAEGKAIKLAAQVDPDLPPVEADPGRMRQVLVNLVANALQFTPEGGAVSLQAGTEGDQVLLRVSDTGPGIAPADLPHIFDRFYRADKARSRSAGGSGLGLAIVRSLVEAHGGSVGVHSEPGKGTSFEIRLPRG